MYTDEDSEGPLTVFQVWLGIFKKFFTGALVMGLSAGILYALWEGASDSTVGVGAVYGIAEGIVFVVCVWLGFLIGYFAGKPRGKE